MGNPWVVNLAQTNLSHEVSSEAVSSGSFPCLIFWVFFFFFNEEEVQTLLPIRLGEIKKKNKLIKIVKNKPQKL